MQLVRDNPIVALILACEVGLWVLLGLGLVARYLLRQRMLSTLLLAAIPLLDVVLFVATPEQSGQLSWWIGRVWVVVGIWLVAGPLWESGGSRATADRR